MEVEIFSKGLNLTDSSAEDELKCSTSNPSIGNPTAIFNDEETEDIDECKSKRLTPDKSNLKVLQGSSEGFKRFLCSTSSLRKDAMFKGKHSYKGGKINHKSLDLCYCKHCYIWSTAASQEALPEHESFARYKLPSRSSDEVKVDKVKDLPRDLCQDLDSFIEQWADHTICSSIYSAAVTAATWTYQNLQKVWKMSTACFHRNQVAPTERVDIVFEVTSPTTLNDDEFNGNQYLRRTTSCEF